MTKKKVIILADKKTLFQEKFAFFRKSAIFSRNFPKTYKNLTLGFLGFFYCPILGFQFFLSGNTGCRSIHFLSKLFISRVHRYVGQTSRVVIVTVAPFNFRIVTLWLIFGYNMATGEYMVITDPVVNVNVTSTATRLTTVNRLQRDITIDALKVRNFILRY